MSWLWLLWMPLSAFLFSLLNFKIWEKKNHWSLNLFYSLTFLIPYLFETLYFILLRNKYNKATAKTLNLLSEKGLKFHIVFGTFLFAYRDNNFRDTDIDISVYRDDFDKKQKKILKEAGFVLKEQWKLDGLIAEQSYYHPKDKIHMDIFHISKGKEFAPTFDEKNNRYARRPETYKYSLSEYTIQEVKVLGPSKPEEYLSWNYGEWKKRDKDYHWFHGSSSHPTIIVENADIEYEKFD